MSNGNESGMTDKRREIGSAIVYALLAALGIILIWVVFQTYGISDAIREQQKVNTDTYERIVSCTDPGGKCAEKAQEATAKAVADIGRVSVYAAACAEAEARQPNFSDLSKQEVAERVEECVTELIGGKP